MSIYSNQPAMMFYMGNYLEVQGGRGGRSYGMHDAFCMEPQGFPDAINQVHTNR
jgi:aldose 1-epimerase